MIASGMLSQMPSQDRNMKNWTTESFFRYLPAMSARSKATRPLFSKLVLSFPARPAMTSMLTAGLRLAIRMMIRPSVAKRPIPMMMIAASCGIRYQLSMNMDQVKALSTKGSPKAPILLCMLNLRAKCPSAQSQNQATTK